MAKKITKPSAKPVKASPAPKKAAVAVKPTKSAKPAASGKAKPEAKAKSKPNATAAKAQKPAINAKAAAGKPSNKVKSTPIPKKTTPAKSAKTAAPATKPAKSPAAAKTKASEKPVEATVAKAAKPAAEVKAAKAPAPAKATQVVEAAPVKAAESVKAVKPATSKKSDVSKSVTGKPKAPAAPPVPMPPPVKRTVPDAPELVIKQAYSPAKMPPFIKKQQQRLIELQGALLDSLDGVTKEAIRARPEGGDSGVGGMHMGDAGSDSYDRDFALSMLSKEQDALYEIKEALKRVDDGVYGICELSGKKIPDERLEALPYTRYTRDMQEQIERDQIGGRFRRPVVRSVFGLDDASEDDDDEGEEETSRESSSNNDSSLDSFKD